MNYQIPATFVQTMGQGKFSILEDRLPLKVRQFKQTCSYTYDIDMIISVKSIKYNWKKYSYRAKHIFIDRTQPACKLPRNIEFIR